MMRKTLPPLLAVLVAVLLAVPALGQPAMAKAEHAWTYSPLTAVGVGPSGPATAKILVEPYCCPSTAVVVQAESKVAEDDFQWVNLGLTVPAVAEIQAVEVCYELKTSKPGATYISQTRLTDMTTPDVAHVKLDDATDRKDSGPACYTVEAGFQPEGTVTLALKMVFGSTEDEIRIGMVKLQHEPKMMRRMQRMKKMEGGGS